MSDRSRPDEERERISREEEEVRQEEIERRSEELREAWRRNHPSEYEEEGKRRPKKSNPRSNPD